MAIIVHRDIQQLDPRLLLAFDALMAENNVTRAAARLRLTQQGLSGQLARLRALFGDPLFVRDGAGVTPTPLAEALAPRVRTAIGGLQALVEKSEFNPGLFDGVLTIAATDYAVAVVLPGLLKRLHAVAPRLRIAGRSVRSSALEAELEDRKVDFGLIVPEFTPSGLRSRKLFSEHYVGVMREGHPLGARPVDLDAFCLHPHVLVSPDKGDFRGTVDEALERLGRSRRVALVLPTFAVASTILENSDMIGVLPSRLLEGKKALRTFAPPLPIPGFDLCGVWPQRLHSDPAHRWFRGVCFGA